MDTSLTQFERSLVEAILRQHFGHEISSKSDLSHLRVVQRKSNSAGGYVTFEKNQFVSALSGKTLELGFDGEITIPDLPSGLGAVLLLEKGELRHLELFSYGNELWDGRSDQGRITSWQ